MSEQVIESAENEIESLEPWRKRIYEKDLCRSLSERSLEATLRGTQAITPPKE